MPPNILALIYLEDSGYVKSASLFTYSAPAYWEKLKFTQDCSEI